MATEVNELIQRLTQLQTTNYEDPVAARKHNVNAEAALSLIFDIGREKIPFSDEQKQTVASKLVAAIRPIQVNVQNHAFEFNPKINTVLEKRSALQFLLDDHKDLPVPDGTLSNVFERVILKETVQILDDIIEKNRKKSASDKELIKRYQEEFGTGSDEDSDPDIEGVPSSHSWWFY